MGHKKRRFRNSPKQTETLSAKPTHCYVICSQRRERWRIGQEEFLVAAGPASQGSWEYRSRAEARKAIMTMVNDPGWEHRNPHAAHYFYWAKRIELGPHNTKTNQ